MCLCVYMQPTCLSKLTEVICDSVVARNASKAKKTPNARLLPAAQEAREAAQQWAGKQNDTKKLTQVRLLQLHTNVLCCLQVVPVSACLCIPQLQSYWVPSCYIKAGAMCLRRPSATWRQSYAPLLAASTGEAPFRVYAFTALKLHALLEPGWDVAIAACLYSSPCTIVAAPFPCVHLGILFTCRFEEITQRIDRYLTASLYGVAARDAALQSAQGIGVALLAAESGRKQILWEFESDAAGSVILTQDCWTVTLREMKAGPAGAPRHLSHENLS